MRKTLFFLMVALVAATGISAPCEPKEIKTNKTTVVDEVVVPSGVVIIGETTTKKAEVVVKKMETEPLKLIEEEPEPVWNIGYTTAYVAVRKGPSRQTDKITNKRYNEEVMYRYHNDNWSEVLIDNETYYIASKYISDVPAEYMETSIPKYPGMKTYMSYRAITSTASKQYKLQQSAYTGFAGIRLVEDRYCVALGTGTGATVGDYGEIELENGTVLPVIVGDIKANIHTDASNIFTVHSNCCSEFLVDMNHLDSTVKKLGDVSYAKDSWKSRVVAIRIFEENYFE